MLQSEASKHLCGNILNSFSVFCILYYRGHLVLVPQTLHLVLILVFVFFPLSIIAGNEYMEAGERRDKEKMFASTVELAFNRKFDILPVWYRKRMFKKYLLSGLRN